MLIYSYEKEDNTPTFPDTSLSHAFRILLFIVSISPASASLFTSYTNKISH